MELQQTRCPECLGADIFDDVTLTIVHLPGQIIRHVTPLSALQIRILELLGLSPGVYTRLAEN